MTCPATPATLAPLAFVTCSATYAVTQADIDAGFVTNVAMGHGMWGEIEIDSNQDSTTVNATQTPALTLDKTVTESSYDSVGDILTYSYKLTNSGNVTLAAPYSVDDDKTTVTCPATPATLAPLAFVTCTATYAVTQADIDAGSVSNVATAHGMRCEIDIELLPQDSTDGNAPQTSAWTLDKTVPERSDDSVGDILSYSFKVTNTGNVTLASPYSVDDVKTTVTCPATPLAVAPLAFVTCTATYAVTQADIDAGSVSNLATAHDMGSRQRLTRTKTGPQ